MCLFSICSSAFAVSSCSAAVFIDAGIIYTVHADRVHLLNGYGYPCLYSILLAVSS